MTRPACQTQEHGTGSIQQIIRFRPKLAKGMDEDERHALERRVAAYRSSLVKGNDLRLVDVR
jgi:hypothetical protein